jgi:hypothetical protein
MLQSSILGEERSQEAPFPLSSAAGHTTLPALHRQVLMWLLEDLVLLFIETDQIKAFRPRRNQRSSTRKLLI